MSVSPTSIFQIAYKLNRVDHGQVKKVKSEWDVGDNCSERRNDNQWGQLRNHSRALNTRHLPDLQKSISNKNEKNEVRNRDPSHTFQVMPEKLISPNHVHSMLTKV